MCFAVHSKLTQHCRPPALHKTGLESWHLGGEVEEEREAEAQGVLVPPVCWFLSFASSAPRLVILQEPDSDGSKIKAHD